MNVSHVLRSKVSLAAAAIVGALALGGSQARATTYTVYSDAASFAAAFASVDTYGFTGGDGSLVSRPYILGPLGFSTVQHLTHLYLMNDGVYGSGVSYLQTFGPGPNSASQPEDGEVLYALGFDLATPEGADTITLKMNFSDTLGTLKTSGTPGTTTFIGILSSDPISQVSFTTTGNSTELDTVRFYVGTPAVPEPSSACLAGLAAPALLARRRRV